MNRYVVIGAVAIVVGLGFGRAKPPAVEAAPPLAVLETPTEREAPMQRATRGDTPFSVNGYVLKPLAEYAVTARVLSVETYRSGRESELSPVDLALGWGRMSSPAVTDKLSISQSGRWYHWRYRGSPPIPHREIETSSANTHVIPASAEVARALGGVRKGAVVTLKGYLVEAAADDGWRWRSSISRDDTGNGSCEIMFVQSLDVR